MKLAIHHREGSFSDRWIAYCKSNDIAYKIVNAYGTDIIENLKDCDALMWHHHHGSFQDELLAKPILYALEHAGVKVFPDFKTAWHFDNKVAQKYLFEFLDAPHITSYVFYNKKAAIEWANKTIFPKVFKLKGGAGSANVQLVHGKNQSVKLINTAFGKGFKQFDGKAYFIDNLKKYNSGKKSLKQVMKAFGRMFVSTEFSKVSGRERGYIYFQDFVPNNDSDIRVIVIDGKAFGLKRMVRKGDFRASGSGEIRYSIDEIDTRCIQIAFETNKKLNSQCIAFDFVFDTDRNPLIVEISFGFSVPAYDQCEGYWTEDMQFIEEEFNPQAWMVESLINS
jgi:glutathione synthase/RimK-type ligase-like ATP-grasp enzyme